jgi:hypothetical protein
VENQLHRRVRAPLSPTGGQDHVYLIVFIVETAKSMEFRGRKAA